jgi:endonuclease YncB( thermonuclease family)
MPLHLLLILAVCLLCPMTVLAEPATSDMRLRVFKVFDGDRLMLRGRGKSYRVQLAGIDAPELDQPWGQRSRQVLEKMVAGQRVTVEFLGEDAQRVRVRFLDYDIGTEMLAAGAAWALPDAPDQLKAIEEQARAEGKGLWAPGELPPVAPWDWRAQQ